MVYEQTFASIYSIFGLLFHKCFVCLLSFGIVGQSLVPISANFERTCPDTDLT